MPAAAAAPPQQESDTNILHNLTHLVGEERPDALSLYQHESNGNIPASSQVQCDNQDENQVKIESLSIQSLAQIHRKGPQEQFAGAQHRALAQVLSFIVRGKMISRGRVPAVRDECLGAILRWNF